MVDNPGKAACCVPRGWTVLHSGLPSSPVVTERPVAVNRAQMGWPSLLEGVAHTTGEWLVGGFDSPLPGPNFVKLPFSEVHCQQRTITDSLVYAYTGGQNDLPPSGRPDTPFQVGGRNGLPAPFQHVSTSPRGRRCRPTPARQGTESELRITTILGSSPRSDGAPPFREFIAIS